MELTLKTDLNIDQELYIVHGNHIHDYKKCSACNGIGKVKLTLDSKDYTITCPACKGDKENLVTREYLEYEVRAHTVEGFKYDQNYTDKVFHWYAQIGTVDYIQLDILPLVYKDSCDRYCAVFTKKGDAVAEAKRLNKLEKEKYKHLFAEENSNKEE